MADTFNPNNKAADVLLTNGNKTMETTQQPASNIGGVTTIGSKGPADTNRYYWELIIPNPLAGRVYAGFAKAGWSVDTYVGNTNSIGWLDDGRIFQDGSQITGSAPTFGAGDVIGIEFQCDTTTFVPYVNGVASGGVNYGAADVYFAAVSSESVGGSFGDQLTGAWALPEMAHFPGGAILPWDAEIVATVPSAGYALDGGMPYASNNVVVLSAQLALVGAAGGLPLSIVPSAAYALDGVSARGLIDIPNVRSYTQIFRCYIQGPPSTLEILISSVQGRLRGDTSDYLSVVAPNVAQIIDDIEARIGNKFTVYSGVRYDDGSEQLAEMARATLETVRYDAGPSQNSVTLTGYEPAPTIAPTTRTLPGASYQNTQQPEGDRRYRYPYTDPQLRPGDTVITEGDTFVVKVVTYTINARQHTMEIAG